VKRGKQELDDRVGEKVSSFSKHIQEERDEKKTKLATLNKRKKHGGGREHQMIMVGNLRTSNYNSRKRKWAVGH